jgi:hypothetical protein
MRAEIDGYEMAPLLGGAVDQHLLTLAEIEHIAASREAGGYVVGLRPYRRDRREPYSRIEGGSGDRGADVLRAFFAAQALGAPFGFGFDRIVSEGAADVGSAERNLLWANLSYPVVAGVWAQLEYRGLAADRDSFPSPSRSDWILRLRREFQGGWYTDVVAGTADLKIEPAAGASPEDTAVQQRTARQLTLRAARQAEHWQAYVAMRIWDGDGLPSIAPQASLAVQAGPASLYATGSYADWGDFSTTAGYASLSVALPLGLRALAEIEDGDRGLYGDVLPERYEFSRWTAGAELTLFKEYRLGGRLGEWRVEPSPGLGLPTDTITLPGGQAGVVEAWAWGLLARLFGGRLEAGAYYQEHEAGDFLYWPRWSWRAEGLYHVLALNDQLEVRLSGIGGVRGPMYVPDPSQENVARTTGNLNYWRAEASVRIKDVYLWYNYEFFQAVSGGGDLLNRRLPVARAHFGLKWEFWN